MELISTERLLHEAKKIREGALIQLLAEGQKRSYLRLCTSVINVEIMYKESKEIFSLWGLWNRNETCSLNIEIFRNIFVYCIIPFCYTWSNSSEVSIVIMRNMEDWNNTNWKRCCFLLTRKLQSNLIFSR